MREVPQFACEVFGDFIIDIMGFLAYVNGFIVKISRTNVLSSKWSSKQIPNKRRKKNAKNKYTLGDYDRTVLPILTRNEIES